MKIGEKFSLTALKGLVYATTCAGSLFFSTAVQAQGEEFYTLMCSYSQTMSIAFDTSRRPVGQGQGAMIEFTFEHAPQGYQAAPSSLRPGQCTWMDRPLKESEPRKVRLYQPTVKGMRIKRDGRGRSAFQLTGQSAIRQGREDFDLIYSMPAEEGTLFKLRAQQALESLGRGRGFSRRDYFYAEQMIVDGPLSHRIGGSTPIR